MSRRNLIIIGIVIVVVVIAVGGYFYMQQQNAQRTAAAARQTATLSRGELDASVTGGVQITKINVQVGDQVKAGDVLAEEDAEQLAQQVSQAKANLASAQSNLTDLQAAPKPADLAVAQATVRSAQAAYDSAEAKLASDKAPPSATDLQAAQAQVVSAKAAYDAAAAKASMKDDQIKVARAAVDTAQVTLQAAQAAYDAIAWRSNAPSTTQATDLQNATIAYESAQSSYKLALADINDSAVKSAEASLATAQSNLKTLTEGATAATLAADQASIDSANQSLLSAKENLDTVQAGTTQTDLLTAQASVASAQAALDTAQRAADQSKIIAPFDGTVATVTGVVGQTATSGAAVITIVNTGDLETEISLSEVDVAQVKPGQDVQLEFDALGGQTFPGKVLSVSPLGTITSGVVNYNVNVGLVKPDPSILPGMTAQATIITARVPDALIAPNRAIRTQGTRHILTVLQGGQEIPILVQTGLVNDTNTQIKSATLVSDGTPVQLEDGDTVILNTTTTTTPGGGPGGFGGGGFGIPIGR
jgi:HlyD family secretion protein